ncbi:hypothetical protein [Pyxidicoccus trucidator]|uniref:hypothetical protein n=1 Tax=Pyxidicoccus trucidator TaxID=2709662 RepID=UPI0013DB6E8D|nr:hypothetical protein [Pyxidicoccus trucidator]
MFKQVLRPLCLGVLVACASACGGELDALEVEEVGTAEQGVCQVGSYISECRDFGNGGYSSPSCPGQFAWSYWNCKQYRYYSGPTTYYYRQECGPQKTMCGSSATTPPGLPEARCKQNC